MLNALDWVNDSLGFAGVLTTMSAAGIPFPTKGTKSYEIIKEFNNGKGFPVYSSLMEWRRLSEYPQDKVSKEASLLGAIFDRQSPPMWMFSYERECIARGIPSNPDPGYWIYENEIINAERPGVTMIFASEGERGIFYREINPQHYNKVINLRDGRQGKVSGEPVTMWVTPYNVDICPPPTWNAGISQSFT